MKTITKSMVRKGYKRGIIRLVDMNDETVCFIGDNWFYFDLLGEDYTPEQYKTIVPEDTIIQEIFSALESFRNMSEFKDEYLYYYEYLVENGIS